MTDRTVSVILQARITDYMAKFSAASKATTDFANKVEVAKGRAAQGYHAIGVAGVAMGAAVAGGFALAVKSAADFDAKMALVRTLAHASAGDMGQLRDAALHAGQAYGYTATQVADAEAELVKAGVSVSDIMGGALTGALTLASAGQTDVATATTIAATAMTQFALKGKDVPHIADLLAAGADKALGSVVDLGYALDQAGPQAHQFGVSIEETIGTLAAFAQAGQIGERGGTVFSQMLLKLAAPSKQANDILRNLGITLYNQRGQFVGISNLAGQLQDKMSGLTEAERNHDLAVIFGQRAIRGANILYQEGAQGIADWTKKVNDAGFASLQASGKLDSLSGDFTKLKAALQTAFIGAGEGSQGPLRVMVQDVTKAVEVWNELPGPVRAAAEVFTLAGGAVTLAGGAALLFIPKWAAMNAALKDTSVGAISAKGALASIAKGGAVIGALTAVTLGAKALGDEFIHDAAPAVDKFNTALTDLANNGMHLAAGELQTLAAAVVQAKWGVGSKAVTNLDTALAGLVTSGHLDTAQSAFSRLSAEMHRQGMSTDEIARKFPQFTSALSDSATQARNAGTGIDSYGNAVTAAAKATQKATDAAKRYSNQLHALTDPLFAMNQALQGVVDAQYAASTATKKYGTDSAQARQANLDLASAALDAETAARTLATAVKNGSVSIGDARKFLKAWVSDGLLTKQQADDVSSSFDHLIGRAETISGLHPHMTVTADTSQAESALNNIISLIGQTISAALSLGGVQVPGPSAGGMSMDNARRLGITVGSGHSGGSSGSASTGDGKFYTPTNSDAGYYTPGGSGGSGGGSGGGGSSGSSKQRPPSVQEIVHAILTGTIPPSIDQLRKTLQTEIRHLSSAVGSAQQYRSSIRSSLLGYASLSNVPEQTDAYGRSMGMQNVNSYLKGRLAQLKQFVTLRQRLENKGAGEGLLEEFDALGPQANPMMRQLLAGGKHAVTKATRLEGRIHHLANTASGVAASDKYGGQIVRLLERAPHEEARLIAKALGKQQIDLNMKHLARQRGHRIRNKSS